MVRDLSSSEYSTMAVDFVNMVVNFQISIVQITGKSIVKLPPPPWNNLIITNPYICQKKLPPP